MVSTVVLSLATEISWPRRTQGKLFEVTVILTVIIRHSNPSHLSFFKVGRFLVKTLSDCLLRRVVLKMELRDVHISRIRNEKTGGKASE